MADIKSHHMIYGRCLDYLTGESIVDTDDERYRQQLTRFLVEKKGFNKNELTTGLTIETLFAGQFVVSKIDIVVSLDNRQIMVLRYGPGSLVTRERPALAAARVLNKEQRIPLTVVTNGEDAEILNTGMDKIPDRQQVCAMLADLDFSPLAEKKREPELRILNAFDVEICCAGGPCALPGAKEG